MARLCLSFMFTLNPLIQLFVWTALSISLRPSIANIKRKGDNGSPCLKPFSDEKKLVGETLIKTENFAVVVQNLIQSIHFPQNPCFPKSYIGNPKIHSICHINILV